MFEEYFFEKQRVINIFAQFHMRIEFSLKSIGYNNFNEQMMISETVTEALAQARLDPLLADQPLKPLVVADMDLQAGQLIDYRITDTTGGVYPYGGRVVKVIDGTNSQQLVLLNFEILATYDVLMSGDKQFIEEGVMPEFVTYRSGTELADQTEAGEELSYFGPKERATIQWDFKLFGMDCKTGIPPAVAVSPFFKFDLSKGLSGIDAGFKFSFGVNTAEVDCTIIAKEGAEVWVPIGGPIGALLQKITGTGIVVGPYGEIKTKLSAGSGFTNFTFSGGYSIQEEIPEKFNWNGSFGSGLEANPVKVETELVGELGMQATLSAVELSLFWFDFEISLQNRLGWFLGLKGKALNAAAVSGQEKSGLAIESGAKFTTALSKDLVSMLKWFGLKGEFKPEFAVSYTKAFDAEYKLGYVNDQGTGSATARIHPANDVIAVLTGTKYSSAKGYASIADKDSSVYNDPNDNITYDTEECKSKGGNFDTPFIACLGGFFCGPVDKSATLCGGQLSLSTLYGNGNVGDEVTANGWVRIEGGGSSTSARDISVDGSPLQPEQRDFTLTPGEYQDFTATTTCTSTGVFKGTIVAEDSAGNAVTIVHDKNYFIKSVR